MSALPSVLHVSDADLQDLQSRLLRRLVGLVARVPREVGVQASELSRPDEHWGRKVPAHGGTSSLAVTTINIVFHLVLHAAMPVDRTGTSSVLWIRASADGVVGA